MRFHYIASQPDGKIVESDYDAFEEKEVLEFLNSQGFRPISIKKAGFRISTNTKIVFNKSINLTDKIFLSKYLALMLKIGMGLIQAIDILIEDFDKTAMKSFLLEVRAGLEKGMTFYSTFAKYPKVFSQSYINLVKAGEASGNLENVFEDLTLSLAKEKLLKDQIRNALIYPILLLVASLLIMIFLIAFAIPKIANVFTDSGFDPPVFSKVVFAIGLFFNAYGIYILGFFVLLISGAVVAYRLSLTFKKVFSGILRELPVVKDLVKKTALQRFSATLSSLIKAGIPLDRALEITADAVSDMELKQTLIRISREGLGKGLTVGEAFKREAYFPKVVVNLIAISEKAGHIEDVLTTLSEFYISEIDSSLKTLVSFLEPIMLLFIGSMIGLIALAIIIPIYQLTSSF